ncbi:hypothetical protein D3C73_731180 [compost metagenome]
MSCCTNHVINLRNISPTFGVRSIINTSISKLNIPRCDGDASFKLNLLGRQFYSIDLHIKGIVHLLNIKYKTIVSTWSCQRLLNGITTWNYYTIYNGTIS